jgi:hypothetical protein
LVLSIDESLDTLHHTSAFCLLNSVPCLICAADLHSGYVTSNFSQALKGSIKPPAESLSTQRLLLRFLRGLIPVSFGKEETDRGRMRGTRSSPRIPRVISPLATSVIGSVGASEALKLLLLYGEGKDNQGARQASSWFEWHGDVFLESKDLRQEKGQVLKRSPELSLLSSAEPSASLSLLSHYPCSPSQHHAPSLAPLPRHILSELRNMTILLVGSGAIGCEILKLLSQLLRPPPDFSLSTASGKILVADPDSVESSNLNRQVLFG